MAHQQVVEGAPIVDAASSYPNTPLNGSQTVHECNFYRPSSLPSTPCLSSTVFFSDDLHPPTLHPAASAEAAFPRQRGPGSSLPDAPFLPNEHNPDNPLPSPKSSTTSTLHQECSSFVELLLSTACLSCQAASRQILEKHVRREKFRKICEALTSYLQLRVGAEVAPAFPGTQQLPLLASAVAVCTLKEQCRLLLSSACSDDSSVHVANSEGFHHSTLSHPYSCAAACSLQRLRASTGITTSHVSRAQVADSPVAVSSGKTDVNAVLHSENGLAYSSPSFPVATDSREEGSKSLVHNDALHVSHTREAKGASHKSCVASVAAATKRRRFPVQYVRIRRSENGKCPEISLQMNLPTQESQTRLEGFPVLPAPSYIASIAAEGPPASADSIRSKGRCAETATSQIGENQSSEEESRGRVRTENAPVASRRGVSSRTKDDSVATGIAVAQDNATEKQGGPASALEEVVSSEFDKTSALATARRPRNAGAPNSQADTLGGGAPCSFSSSESTAEKQMTSREEQGLESGTEDELRRERLIEDVHCNGTSAAHKATARPPVARLTLQQLEGVVGAAQLYCDVLGKQLDCFTENMTHLQRLWQLETLLQTKRKVHSIETRTTASGKECDEVLNGVDDVSGCVDGGNCQGSPTRGNAEKRNSRSIDYGAESRLVQNIEKIDHVDTFTVAPSNGRLDSTGTGLTADKQSDPSVVDSGDTTQERPSLPLQQLLQQQEESKFMSMLQRLQLPRDNNLTAAQVLGFSAVASNRTGAAGAQGTPERGTRTHGPAASPDATNKTPGIPVSAAALDTTGNKNKEAEEININEATGDTLQESLCATARGEETVAKAVPSATEGKPLSAAAAADPNEDRKYSNGQRNKEQQRQQRRIVSLADLPDLSVLEQSRDSVEAACRWQQSVLRKRALWRHKADKALNPIVPQGSGQAAKDKTHKEVRRDSSESSVVFLEHNDGSRDGDPRTSDKDKGFESPSKKKRKSAGTHVDTGPFHGETAAAEVSEDEMDIIAGAREVEALCEAVGRESVKLLELVTFYENFSAECLTCATPDHHLSDDENNGKGEHT